MPKYNCVVPLFVKFGSIDEFDSEELDSRCVSATSVGPGIVVVEGAAPAGPDPFVWRNKLTTGFSLVPEIEFDEDTSLVEIPMGGKISVNTAALLHLIAMEGRPLSDIPVQLSFNDRTVLLTSALFSNSDLLSFEIEDEAQQLTIDELTTGEMYMISSLESMSTSYDNEPLRFIGIVGSGTDRRGLFLAPSNWMFQVGGATVFRTAKDKSHTVPDFKVYRRLPEFLGVIQEAADEAWYKGETFSCDDSPVLTVLTSFSPAFLSYTLGMILLNGSVELDLAGIHYEVKGVALSFGRQGKLQLKAKVRNPSNHLVALLGPSTPTNSRRTHAFSRECKVQLPKTACISAKLDAFRECLQELISLALPGFEDEKGLLPLYRPILLPRELENSRYGWLRDGCLLVNIR